MKNNIKTFLIGLIIMSTGQTTEVSNPESLDQHEHLLISTSTTSNELKNSAEQPLAYAVDIKKFNDNPYLSYTHTLDGFNNRTFLASHNEDNLRPYAITWTADKSKMYALSREDDKYLISINPENGVSTRLSKLKGYPRSQMVQGMAIDENNTCYLIATDRANHDTSAFLYTCNLQTGAMTLVGSQSLAPDLHDIAATCDGELYGINTATSELYRVDKHNGQATYVGALGLSNEKIVYTLTYDRMYGKLYHYVVDSGFRTAFASIDKQTGEMTYESEYFASGIYVGGIKSSCEDQVETFKLNPGFNGSWFNPETDGQGFFFDLFPNSNVFFAAWFTYDVTAETELHNKSIGSSGHRWFTAAGEMGETNTVELTIYNTVGGAFDDPTAVSSDPIGSMTILFEDCTKGEINYDMYNNQYIGTIPIQRITGDNVGLCESLFNSPR